MKPIHFRVQRGFTLVEVMVALTLGLVILLAIAALFARSSAASRNQDQNAALLETGRFALSEVERAVRQSAFGANGTWTSASEPIVLDASQNYTDVLTIRYEATQLPVSATMADCSGAQLSGNQTATNSFYVETNGNVRQLMCSSSLASAPVVIAPNVEAFRVLKGYAVGSTDIATGDSSGCRLGQLLPSGASAATPLIALKVGVVVRSPQPAPASEVAAMPSAILGGDVASAVSLSSADLSDASGSYLRRAFSSTYFLRNRCPK
ncbi:prepilin-type N-terminal cleavage/methylation domain-containing protein [Crenobacter cavernae]|uniref:prepilin-type N-terminal cleavage/methylation domain-containing protein n=1 Tax=Crenobacter cavernae TaxID=2290923 RepID=UPI001419B5BC|nr:prepilin-type N-terminal cleavage/methylation domain-containing protein [Crenobacter cavernae]